jgi:hypothetical protein
MSESSAKQHIFFVVVLIQKKIHKANNSSKLNKFSKQFIQVH